MVQYIFDIYILNVYLMYIECIEYQNFSGAKAPLCSSWDTGRVAPLVGFAKFCYRNMEYLINVTHRQNISLSSLKASVFYSQTESLFMAAGLLTDGMQKQLISKEKGFHANKQTNSNFINIDE